MRYFVTGANGFIGSYLCRYLLDQGHEVIASGRKFLPEIRNVLNGAEFLEADVLNDSFKNTKIQADVIVHLAAANDRLSKDIRKGTELSVVGTANTMELAVNNGIDKFIFYSTLQVYGGELIGNYDENSPSKPVNDYGMNHLFGELYCEMYSRKHKDFKTLVVRPSNIYGPFLSAEVNRWTLVPGCFCKEGTENGTITLLSSGKQIRNFITLEQLSYATMKAAENMNLPFDSLNLVSDQYHTMLDMAQFTKEVFKEDFRMDVEVKVASSEPTSANEFFLSMSKMEQYGIDLKSIPGVPKKQISSVISTLLKSQSK